MDESSCLVSRVSSMHSQQLGGMGAKACRCALQVPCKVWESLVISVPGGACSALSLHYRGWAGYFLMDRILCVILGLRALCCLS